MLPRGELEFQWRDHGIGNLILDLENVLEFAVVGLGPDLHAGVGAHQLGPTSPESFRLGHVALGQIPLRHVVGDFAAEQTTNCNQKPVPA